MIAYNQPVAVAQPPQQRTEQAPPPHQQTSTGPKPGDMSTDESTSNVPVASYIIPFDRNPKSSPGEQIILGAVFTDPKPNDYQLVYTCSSGESQFLYRLQVEQEVGSDGEAGAPEGRRQERGPDRDLEFQNS